MIKKQRIALLVPDGTGIKNYLYSEVFRDMDASLSLFHNFDKDTLDHIDEHIKIDEYYEMLAYGESFRERFLRELINLARLKHNAKRVSNPTILKFRKRNLKSFKLKLFYGIMGLVAGFIRSYKQILNLEKRYDKAIRKNPFYSQMVEALKTAQPSKVFCTHQRALKAPIFFAAARDLGIPTITVIYSWDNVPKARLALRADTYCVWSEHMKKELQEFYPEIENNQVVVTGTPQFEFYANPENIEEKASFYQRFGLEASKKIICFSGDDVLTSPYDPFYLRDVAQAIVDAKKEDAIQIAFRRCPVDVSGRYDWVLEQFPDLIVSMPPLWNFNSEIWSAVYPTYADVQHLVSLSYYADLVINVGSTMAFDFGMFNKPCIYINYDHVQDPIWSVDTIYKYQHFRSMSKRSAVYWFDSKEEIFETITKAIEKPHTDIKAWYEVVNDTQQNASTALKTLILN